jgi:hypothetical protein
MNLPIPVLQWLRRRVSRVTNNPRDPDMKIGKGADIYLARWYVIPRNPIFNIYLHLFFRSDDDRALHDHPWVNVSILLYGRYTEHTIAAGGVHHRVEYIAGDIKFRTPRYAHRIELTHGECWSLFITGPNVRTWGFHCPAGWRPWREFVDEKNSGSIGKGCD